MRKFLNFCLTLNFAWLPVFNVIACHNDEFLDIPADDQSAAYDEIFTDLALDYMFNLPDNQKPQVPRSHFSVWNWMVFTSDPKTLVGRGNGPIYVNGQPTKVWEYWTVKLRKKPKRWYFVWDWSKVTRADN